MEYLQYELPYFRLKWVFLCENVSTRLFVRVVVLYGLGLDILSVCVPASQEMKLLHSAKGRFLFTHNPPPKT